MSLRVFIVAVCLRPPLFVHVYQWPRLAFSFDLYSERGADSGCPGESTARASLAEPALNWGSFGGWIDRRRGTEPLAFDF